MKQYLLFLCLIFVGATSFAQREVFVFVSTTANGDLAPTSDIEAFKEMSSKLQSVVFNAHLDGNQSEFPRFVDLRLSTMNEFESALRNSVLPGEKVKMLFFAGHGNFIQYHLNEKNFYSGQEMGQIIGGKNLKPLFANDLAIYFGSCLCGYSNDASNFQVQFMNEFRARNEALPESLRTRTLITLAHRFISEGVDSLKTAGLEMSTMLYQRGVLSAVHQIDMLVFKVFGREALARSSLLTGVFFGTTVALAAFAGPDSLKPFLLLSSALIGVAVSRVVRILAQQNALLTQRLVYDSRSESRTGLNEISDTVSALTGLREILSKKTCEGLFR